jgi:hypothetical protein
MDPSGGTDMVENLEKVVSARAGAGRAAPSASCWSTGMNGVGVAMVVGSVAPLSLMEGGVLPDIMYYGMTARAFGTQVAAAAGSRD